MRATNRLGNGIPALCWVSRESGWLKTKDRYEGRKFGGFAKLLGRNGSLWEDSGTNAE